MPPSAAKAKKMLKDGNVKGKKLTPAQRRLFGMIAGGKAPTKLSDMSTSSREGLA